MRPVSSYSMALCCLLLVSSAWAQPQTPAQRGPMTETIKGTLKEIQEKGRSKTLVITDELGGEKEFLLTPKIQFQIEAPGVPGLIVPGRYVSGSGTLTNNQIFVSQINVYFLAPGQKPPAGGVKQSPRMVGASVNGYDLAGVVGETGQSMDYPDYTMVALKVPGRVPPIMLEKNVRVNVISFDTDMAKPGSAVELEVQPLKGDRVNLLKATVTLDEPITGDPSGEAGAKPAAPEEKKD